MIPNPTQKVLSTIRKNQVQALLMGGQACVLYGAAEFSRDTDLAVLANHSNLERLRTAMDELQAVEIAVPPFEARYLKGGHAVHFRCRHPEVRGWRVDIMTVMRGVAAFEELWARRTTAVTPDGDEIDILALPDLVQAKKTQRSKDWPMIERLVEVHYLANRDSPSDEQIEFWAFQMRTPGLLMELSRAHPGELQRFAQRRASLAALDKGEDAIRAALHIEEVEERQRDRAYWQPLKAELEMLRHQRVRG